MNNHNGIKSLPPSFTKSNMRTKFADKRLRNLNQLCWGPRLFNNNTLLIIYYIINSPFPIDNINICTSRVRHSM